SASAMAVVGQNQFQNPSIVFQQAPNGNGGLDADGVNVCWADDFALPQPAVVRSVLWWGAESNPSQSSSGEVSVTLYADDGGKPGAILREMALESVRRFEYTGSNPSGYANFDYVGLLRQPMDVVANT